MHVYIYLIRCNITLLIVLDKKSANKHSEVHNNIYNYIICDIKYGRNDNLFKIKK